MSIFQEWFDDAGLFTFDISPPLLEQLPGHSDPAAFQNFLAGIPSGGLTTGAEQIKPPELAAIFGGTAGVAFDPCYEEECDDSNNSNLFYLGTNAEAASHAIYTLAQVKNFAEYYGIERRGLASDSKDAKFGSAVKENQNTADSSRA